MATQKKIFGCKNMNYEQSKIGTNYLLKLCGFLCMFKVCEKMWLNFRVANNNSLN